MKDVVVPQEPAGWIGEPPGGWIDLQLKRDDLLQQQVAQNIRLAPKGLVFDTVCLTLFTDQENFMN